MIVMLKILAKVGQKIDQESQMWKEFDSNATNVENLIVNDQIYMEDVQYSVDQKWRKKTQIIYNYTNIINHKFQ